VAERRFFLAVGMTGWRGCCLSSVFILFFGEVVFKRVYTQAPYNYLNAKRKEKQKDWGCGVRGRYFFCWSLECRCFGVPEGVVYFSYSSSPFLFLFSSLGSGLDFDLDYETKAT